MMDKLTKRKDLRLKNYDYSSKGAYFVTICVKDRKKILSEIIEPSVGIGAHDDPSKASYLCLTPIGKIVEKHLLSGERIAGVKIDNYVIMPDHLHMIVTLDPDDYALRKNGSSWAPTPTSQMLPHVISTFKRFCNKELGNNIFQRGYIEHIIRDMDDYIARKRYIYENPIRWYYRELYNDSK